MIWKQFSTQVEAAGYRVAIVFKNIRITYEELSILATSVASTLPDFSNKPSRVFVAQKDPLSILVSILACWSRGIVPVVLRDGMTSAQINEMEASLRPVAFLENHFQDERVIVNVLYQRKCLELREEALVICTSGTTGQPKLVALPTESVLITSAAIKKSLNLKSTDRIAVNTPLGYMYGLIGGCISGLLAGASCHFFSPRDPLTQLQAAIRNHGITVVQGPPSLFRLFFAYWDKIPFPDVRVVTTGGEPLGNDLMRDFEHAFPSACKLFLYGMTEAGPRISDLAFVKGGGKDACVGVPYSHFDWRLDPVPGSDAGRLVLRGSSLFLGYINSSGGYEGLDNEGFFHSNDLMTIGKKGQLHFRGRLDRIFRSGGRLVNPEAIERVLASHPDVRDAVCHPEIHPLLGLVPVAEVVLEPETSLDIDSLRELCRKHMEPHAIPRRILAAEAWEDLAESGKRRRASGHN